MKKWASILATVMLLSLLFVPASASYDGTGVDTVLGGDVVSVTMDAVLLDTLSDLEDDVVLSVVPLELSSLPETAEDYQPFAAYELALTCNGEKVDFNGGSVTVEVNYEGDGGSVGCLVDGEIVEEVPLSVSDGKASFTVGHFSTWLVYRDAVLETLFEEDVPLAALPMDMDTVDTTYRRILVIAAFVLAVGGAMVAYTIPRRRAAGNR